MNQATQPLALDPQALFAELTQAVGARYTLTDSAKMERFTGGGALAAVKRWLLCVQVTWLKCGVHCKPASKRTWPLLCRPRIPDSRVARRPMEPITTGLLSSSVPCALMISN